MSKDIQTQPVKHYLRVILIIIAIGGLLLTLVPSFLNWQGIIRSQQVNNLMLAGTIIWFASAIFLFVKKSPL